MPSQSGKSRQACVTTLPDNLPIMLDANTCAAIVGTSAKCIRDRCAKGDIRAVKIGRVWRIERDSFLAQLGLQ